MTLVSVCPTKASWLNRLLVVIPKRRDDSRQLTAPVTGWAVCDANCLAEAMLRPSPFLPVFRPDAGYRDTLARDQ